MVARHHFYVRTRFPGVPRVVAVSDPEVGPDVCSAKGCQSPATWELRWNNPKLHTPERRKVWLACEVHRTTLGDFLGARGFLKETAPH